MPPDKGEATIMDSYASNAGGPTATYGTSLGHSEGQRNQQGDDCAKTWWSFGQQRYRFADHSTTTFTHLAGTIIFYFVEVLYTDYCFQLEVTVVISCSISCFTSAADQE